MSDTNEFVDDERICWVLGLGVDVAVGGCTAQEDTEGAKEWEEDVETDVRCVE